MTMSKVLKILLVLVALAALIQLVPYGRNHSNPPVVLEPNWDSPQTRELAQRACFDCHSNETVWPWYSNVAPVSWLVQFDSEEGRGYLNFSDWNTNDQMINKIEEVVMSGKMPPSSYTLMHATAKLTDAEKTALVSGIQKSNNP
jgi:hypothetical protein